MQLILVRHAPAEPRPEEGGTQLDDARRVLTPKGRRKMQEAARGLVFAVPAVFMLGYWILVQVVGGMASLGQAGGGVAFWAHVGGFLAGAVLILLFRDKRLLDRHPFHGWSQKSHASRSWHRVSGSDRRRRW